MFRPLASSMVLVLSLSLAATAEAQLAADPYDSDSPASVRSSVPIAPYGGFGLETMQTLHPGTLIVDRFGLVREIPFVQPPSSVGPRPRSTASRSNSSGRVPRVARKLPTGSLDWAGANGVILYSPALRFQDYGGGYGRGPYGSVDCGMMYKGMSLGY